MSDGSRAWLIFALIYAVTPAIGVAVFLVLRARLARQGLGRRWQQLLFALFFLYGGLLELCLTAMLWEWSGMASLGAGLLLLAVLPSAVVAAALLRRTSTLSAVQRYLVWSTAAFPVFVLALIGAGEFLYR